MATEIHKKIGWAFGSAIGSIIVLSVRFLNVLAPSEIVIVIEWAPSEDPLPIFARSNEEAKIGIDGIAVIQRAPRGE